MTGNGLVDCFSVIGIDDGGSKGDGGKAEIAGRSPAIRFHAAGLGKSVTLGMKGGVEALAQFAWPKLRYESKRSALAPFKYTFALTLENGQYLYGFCLKMLPPGDSQRYDKGARYPEVLCLTSTRFEVDLFHSLLDCLAGRRLFDAASCSSLFRTVCDVHPCPQPGESFRIRNATLGVQCEYKFTRPRIGEKARCAKVLEHLTPKMLHYVVGAVMCEQRVIFLSKSETTISDVVHGVIALLAPFVWQHMFVPLMPEQLLDYLAAPSPYVVGVLRCFEDKLKQLPLGGTIIADLDRNEIRSTTNYPVEPFGAMPQEKQPAMMRGRREDEAQRLSAAFAQDVLSLYNKAKSSKLQVDERSLRVTWLGFSMTVFGYVTSYVDKRTRNVDKERFVRNVQDPQLRAFVEIFVHTQAFNHFVERQYDHLQRRLNFNKSSGPGGPEQGRTTGGFRESETAIMLQRAEDQVFRAALAQLPSDFGFSDAKRAVKQHLNPRACAPPQHMVQEVLDAIPTTLKAGLAYSLDEDEHFAKIARRSYDSVQARACSEAIWLRVRSAVGKEKSWRHGYNAVLLLIFLVSAGSEFVLASAMEHMPILARLLRARSSGKTDTAKILRRATVQLFQKLLDLHSLKWERSPKGGHKLFLANTRADEANAFQSRRCSDSPWPQFKDLHNTILIPHTSVKPVPPPLVRAPPTRPIRSMPSEDVLEVCAFGHDSRSSCPAPPPRTDSPAKWPLVPPPPPQAATRARSVGEAAPLPKPSSSIGQPPPPPPPPPPRARDLSQDLSPPALPSRDFETIGDSDAPPPPPPRAFENGAQGAAAISKATPKAAPNRAAPRRRSDAAKPGSPITTVSNKPQSNAKFDENTTRPTSNGSEATSPQIPTRRGPPPKRPGRPSAPATPAAPSSSTITTGRPSPPAAPAAAVETAAVAHRPPPPVEKSKITALSSRPPIPSLTPPLSTTPPPLGRAGQAHPPPPTAVETKASSPTVAEKQRPIPPNAKLSSAKEEILTNGEDGSKPASTTKTGARPAAPKVKDLVAKSPPLRPSAPKTSTNTSSLVQQEPINAIHNSTPDAQNSPRGEPSFSKAKSLFEKSAPSDKQQTLKEEHPRGKLEKASPAKKIVNEPVISSKDRGLCEKLCAASPDDIRGPVKEPASFDKTKALFEKNHSDTSAAKGDKAGSRVEGGIEASKPRGTSVSALASKFEKT